jgi:hypothetical protein
MQPVRRLEVQEDRECSSGRNRGCDKPVVVAEDQENSHRKVSHPSSKEEGNRHIAGSCAFTRAS